MSQGIESFWLNWYICVEGEGEKNCCVPQLKENAQRIICACMHVLGL